MAKRFAHYIEPSKPNWPLMHLLQIEQILNVHLQRMRYTLQTQVLGLMGVV